MEKILNNYKNEQSWNMLKIMKYDLVFLAKSLCADWFCAEPARGSTIFILSMFHAQGTDT